MFCDASTAARSKPAHSLPACSRSCFSGWCERRPGIKSEILQRTFGAGSLADASFRLASARGVTPFVSGSPESAASSGLGAASRRDRARRWRAAGSVSSSVIADAGGESGSRGAASGRARPSESKDRSRLFRRWFSVSNMMRGFAQAHGIREPQSLSHAKQA